MFIFCILVLLFLRGKLAFFSPLFFSSLNFFCRLNLFYFTLAGVTFDRLPPWRASGISSVYFSIEDSSRFFSMRLSSFGHRHYDLLHFHRLFGIFFLFFNLFLDILPLLRPFLSAYFANPFLLLYPCQLFTSAYFLGFLRSGSSP